MRTRERSRDIRRLLAIGSVTVSGVAGALGCTHEQATLALLHLVRQGEASSSGEAGGPGRVALYSATRQEHKRAPSTWTDERVAEATRRYQAGESCSQIAKALGGITRNCVIGLVHRKGLVKPGQLKARQSAPGMQKRIEAKARLPQAPPKPRVAAPVEPRPARALRVIEVNTKPRRFTELKWGECRWPMDMSFAEATAESFFCASPVEREGCSFCPAHARIAFAKTPPMKSGPSTDRRRFNGRQFRTGNARARFAE